MKSRQENVWRFAMSKVTIIGGSGYIGGRVARHFAQHGIDVKTVDQRPQSKVLADLSIPHSICDIRDPLALKKELESTSLVIHTAILQIPKINEMKRLGFEVNVRGTEEICKLVDSLQCRGMILAGSWHVVGESGLGGVINEGFGYRPDKVEDRARMYALSKVAQELVVRLYGEFSNRVYGVLRLGTVLGEEMPAETAASVFMRQALNGEDVTPFKHSMYRPITFVSITDVIEAFYRFANRILAGDFPINNGSLENVINVVHPRPLTVLEVAEIICDAVRESSGGRLDPKIRIIDKGLPMLYDETDKKQISFDVSKSKRILGIGSFVSPEDELRRLVGLRIQSGNRF